jgi:hypothetical protein
LGVKVGSHQPKVSSTVLLLYYLAAKSLLSIYGGNLLPVRGEQWSSGPSRDESGSTEWRLLLSRKVLLEAVLYCSTALTSGRCAVALVPVPLARGQRE